MVRFSRGHYQGWSAFRRPRRRFMLRLEELESRHLFSAGGLDGLLASPAAHTGASVTNLKPVGYHPDQIRHAYGFDQISFTGAAGQTVRGDGSGQTIAIVDAYDDPNIFSDLNVFDKNFQVNGSSSTTLYQQYGPSSSFLTKATPEGAPVVNAGWAGEISLDVEWAHAVAPGAKILLVEAKTGSLSNLLSAVDYARNQPGVVTVSMSWGGSEFSTETFFDGHFTTPAGAKGITFVAASGDSTAYLGLIWPAASPNVLAVGGSSLSGLDSAGNYASGQEAGWTYSTGGYSAFENQPSYQSQVIHSTSRTNPDVAYNADPNTGVAVYDTVAYAHQTGWFQVGGTSAGAPQWAALVAIADQGRALAGSNSLDGSSQTMPAIYQLATTGYSTYFHDITHGSNGYSAGTGYDLVTGLGSPAANQIVKALVGVSGSGASVTLAPTSAPAKTPNTHVNPKDIINGVSDPTTGQTSTNSNTQILFLLSLTNSTPLVLGTPTPPAPVSVNSPAVQFPAVVSPASSPTGLSQLISSQQANITGGLAPVTNGTPYYVFSVGGQGDVAGLLKKPTQQKTGEKNSQPNQKPDMAPRGRQQMPPQPIPADALPAATDGQVWDDYFSNGDWAAGDEDETTDAGLPPMPNDAALVPGLVAFLGGSWGTRFIQPKKPRQLGLPN
jgi:subtilase family serine protease